MRGTWLGTLAAAVVLAAGGCSDGTTLPDEMVACTSDDECTTFTTTCCGCPNSAVRVDCLDRGKKDVAESCSSVLDWIDPHDCPAIGCVNQTTARRSCGRCALVIVPFPDGNGSGDADAGP